MARCGGKEWVEVGKARQHCSADLVAQRLLDMPVPSGELGARRVAGYYEFTPKQALLSARRRPTRANECPLRHSWLAGWAETEGQLHARKCP